MLKTRLATRGRTDEEDWEEGSKLQDDFAESLLLPTSPNFFYHCRDEEDVPIGQLTTYRQKLPGSTFCELDRGGHHFGNNLDLVAKDIKGN